MVALAPLDSRPADLIQTLPPALIWKLLVSQQNFLPLPQLNGGFINSTLSGFSRS